MQSNLKRMFDEFSTARSELAQLQSDIGNIKDGVSAIKKTAAAIIRAGEEAATLRGIAGGLDSAFRGHSISGKSTAPYR